jgi:hypothetical protein
VLEDGAPQQVARFEAVRDLPIHAAVLLDVSASMEDRSTRRGRRRSASSRRRSGPRTGRR